MKHQIINGNNIEELKKFPDNYFDSIVTDPPYGLGKEPNAEELMKDWVEKGYHEIKGTGFMGKEWDAFVPQPLFWKEVFRVLKHGGHVVAFYGTRTYDWGVMAMRFAGFEVRDSLQWVYGCLSDDTEILTRSGYIQYHKFIKLPNFEQQEIMIYDVEKDIYKWEKPERWNQYNIHKDTCYRIESDSTDQIVSRNHRCLIEREGKLVFIQAEQLSEMEYMPTLSDNFFELQESKILQSPMQWVLSGSRMEEKSILERWNNISKEERLLFRSEVEVCKMPKRVFINGKKRWLCSGIQIDNGKTNRQSIIKNRMCSSYRPQSNEQRHKKFNVVLDKQRTQNIRMGRSYSTTLATITPIEYSGVIFCPTVSTGCFVARRNGKIFITGNSGFPKSHNIGKAIDKMPKASSRLYEFAELLKQKRKEIGISITEADKLICNGSTMYSFIEGRNINGVLKIYPPNKEFYENIKKHFNIDGWDDIVENNLENIGNELGSFGYQTNNKRWIEQREIKRTTTEQAKQWDGWGSALKPAVEPIVLARKPLEKGLSIAENVLKWGTGGINIDGCRVVLSNLDDKRLGGNGSWKTDKAAQNVYEGGYEGKPIESSPLGRFPANIILSHHPECECKGLKKVGKGERKQHKDGEVSTANDGYTRPNKSNYTHKDSSVIASYGEETIEDWTCHEDCPIRIMDEQSFSMGIHSAGDTGGASRFFYCAKASKSERNRGLDGFEEKALAFSNQAKAELKRGNLEFSDEVRQHNKINFVKNIHPTVKPVKLMQYLVRLVTPPNGKVLDPFNGSGTTGIACKLEGFEYVGIEMDAEYCKIAQARIENWDEKNEYPINNTENSNENLQENQDENKDDTQLSLF